MQEQEAKANRNSDEAQPSQIQDFKFKGMYPKSRGPRGKRGPRGHYGHRGHHGKKGKTGYSGTNGINGSDGSDGSAGPSGPIGPIGLTGPTGPTGTVDPSTYIYVYGDDDFTTVAGNTKVQYTAVGTALGMSLLPGATDVLISKTGVYAIDFRFRPSFADATFYVVSLTVNDVLSPTYLMLKSPPVLYKKKSKKLIPKFTLTSDLSITGRFVVPLNAGDTVALTVSTDADCDFVAGVINRYISIFQQQ